MARIANKDRLIVALDVPTPDDARRIVSDIGDAASFFKIGYQLVFAGGLGLVGELADRGHKIFLDMKLLDIDNTVAKGVGNIARLGATFLTIHAYPKAMRAAVEGRGDSALKLLGVTVLTSMDDADLAEAGYAADAATLVATRAGQTKEAGMDGIICAPTEAQAMRQALGDDMLVVTPGIRPATAEAGDQKRIMTPARAIRAGADHLVVGRPVVAASDPRGAALAIQAEIDEAFEGASA